MGHLLCIYLSGRNEDTIVYCHHIDPQTRKAVLLVHSENFRQHSPHKQTPQTQNPKPQTLPCGLVSASWEAKTLNPKAEPDDCVSQTSTWKALHSVGVDAVEPKLWLANFPCRSNQGSYSTRSLIEYHGSTEQLPWQ